MNSAGNITSSNAAGKEVTVYHNQDTRQTISNFANSASAEDNRKTESLKKTLPGLAGFWNKPTTSKSSITKPDRKVAVFEGRASKTEAKSLGAYDEVLAEIDAYFSSEDIMVAKKYLNILLLADTTNQQKVVAFDILKMLAKPKDRQNFSVDYKFEQAGLTLTFKINNKTINSVKNLRFIYNPILLSTYSIIDLSFVLQHNRILCLGDMHSSKAMVLEETFKSLQEVRHIKQTDILRNPSHQCNLPQNKNEPRREFEIMDNNNPKDFERFSGQDLIIGGNLLCACNYDQSTTCGGFSSEQDVIAFLINVCKSLNKENPFSLGLFSGAFYHYNEDGDEYIGQYLQQQERIKSIAEKVAYGRFSVEFIPIPENKELIDDGLYYGYVVCIFDKRFIELETSLPSNKMFDEFKQMVMRHNKSELDDYGYIIC
ncbi:MAG: hypothetical protein OXD32_07505 [Endozoicomonadaceae bacterium]|nr:hypothetical protein [Endozoicomonadaceae bacterium]MCY4328912.1 hypothetical protein [Endozoicomonadaceae bacterium]